MTEVIDNRAKLGEASRMTPDNKIRRLHAMKDYLGMALLLREQQEKQAWADKHPNFMAYVASLKIDSYRTVMNLIRMTKDMKDLGYTQAEARTLLTKLGKSKTWIMLRNLDTKIPVKDALIWPGGLTNPALETGLKGKPLESFTARISSGNYHKLMAELKKYGMVEGKKKGLRVGAAFDSFLSKVLSKH